MNNDQLLGLVVGAGLVWWWLKRACKCPDAAPASIAVGEPAPAPMPMVKRDEWASPICPTGTSVGEGGLCYGPGAFGVPSSCPDGYVKDSGSCRDSGVSASATFTVKG